MHRQAVGPPLVLLKTVAEAAGQRPHQPTPGPTTALHTALHTAPYPRAPH